ncbi:MAG TPA: redox-regulated ATPase YchF [Planctomycetaceae bacterium]|nr:redox-regulated ATPase YchF [Planctomycetaceae bacterium]
MKIGLVGYQGSGKSTLFEWLTGVAPDAAQAHVGQSAMAEIPDARIAQLVDIYQPKKITRAAIELVDTPGLARDHQGNAARLAMLREAGCLVLVAAAFDGSDAMADVASFDEDLMLADMEIVAGRLERVAQSLTKPVPKAEREKLQHEQETLKLVSAALDSGKPLRESQMNDEQLKVTRAFRLFSEKPRMIVVNTADDEERPERFTERSTGEMPIVALPAGLELELSRMTPEDRKEFEAEMGVGGSDRDGLIRQMLAVSGHMVFFTAGEKEVRTWLLHQGGTALEAADGIHSDLARGFIRAEIMTCADLIRLGSEREVKAHHLVRQEPKDYVVRDDDILLIRFSV